MGSAAHINLDSHLSKEQYLKILDYNVKEGVQYFTFNIPNTKCEECGYIVKAPITECPHCGSKNLTYYTRIIGYLRPTTAFSADRSYEEARRNYINGKNQI